jgi:hypothetical protein
MTVAAVALRVTDLRAGSGVTSAATRIAPAPLFRGSVLSPSRVRGSHPAQIPRNKRVERLITLACEFSCFRLLQIR